MPTTTSSQVGAYNQRDGKILDSNRWLLIFLFAVAMVWFAFFMWKGLESKGDEGTMKMFVYLAFLPLGLMLAYAGYRAEKIKAKFWREFAAQNSWSYSQTHDLSKELAVMLKQGDRRYARHLLLKNNLDGYPTRIFNYVFTVQAGKTSMPFYYTVFGFTFKGSFPHIYLDRNRSGNVSAVTGERIPLPSAFEEKFKLYAPREYEIEALQIFTPDILNDLLEIDFKHDVEFVNQELLVFIDGETNSLEKFNKEFEAAKKIRDLLSPTLNSIKFSPIGDRPYYLSR